MFPSLLMMIFVDELSVEPLTFYIELLGLATGLSWLLTFCAGPQGYEISPSWLPTFCAEPLGLAIGL